MLHATLEMAFHLPAAISQPFSRGTDLLQGAVGGISWGPALSVSKAAVTSLLSRIEIGQLIIKDETTGKTTTYGQKIAKESSKATYKVNGTHKKINAVRKVELVVRREAFWVRLFLFGDMGFAEAYMLGDFECDNLTTFFEVRRSFEIFRREAQDDRNSYSLSTALNWLMRQHGPLPLLPQSPVWQEAPTLCRILC